MHKARKDNIWPSLHPDVQRHRNKAGRLIKWALMVLVMVGAVATPWAVQGQLRFLPFVLVLLALLPLAVRLFRAIRRNGLLAASPAACWGPEDPNQQPEWVDVAPDRDWHAAWAAKAGG
jgi:hypothetical protein